MKHKHTGRIAAGVIAASLAMQGSSVMMNAFAEETQTTAPETTAETTTTAAPAATAPDTGVKATASDALTLANVTTVPAELAQGRLVNVRGTVTSQSSNITSVTVGIYDANGSRLSGGTAQPGSRTYDLSHLDDFVVFDKLAAGSYSFRVIASNGANSSVTLANQSFKVVGSGTSSTQDNLTITNGTVIPDTLAQGKAVNVKGTVSSGSSVITALTVGIYDANGKFITGRTIAPRVKSYDLSRLDNYVAFNTLAAGKYTYAVIASNSGNTNYALVNKSFTVGTGTSTTTTTTSTSDTLTISGGTTVPSNLAVGKAVNVTGIVTSGSSNMTALTVGVYDAGGKFVTGRTINPAARSYDLRKLDNYVAFNKLAAGSYTYAVIASNAANNNYTIVNQKFTVGSGSTTTTTSNSSDALTISGGTTVPDTIAVGKAVNVRGTVTSASSNMTALTVGVYDSNGRFVTGRTIAPNVKSYDLSRLDAYVAFNKLTAGNYTYAVIASNAANTNYTLVNKKFTVGGTTTTTTTNTGDALTITGGTTVPDTIAVGKAVNVRGTVTSASSNMTALTVGVYDSNGRFVTGRTIAPNVKSYDLSRLDAYVAFNKLTAGNYTYAVIASNAANSNYTLVNKKFTVGSGTTTTTSTTGDALTITGSTDVPDSIAVGRAVNVRGTVTSASSNMTALTVGVYDAAGKFVTGRTINPGSRSYDLSRLDAYVAFNKLAAGSYTYAVIASNASNTNYTLVNKKFTVGGGSSTTTVNDALTISGGTAMPSTITKGRGVIVRGTVTSGSTGISSVTVGVYDTAGNRVTGGSATPNAKSYNLSALDSQVRFDQLPTGTYSYRVIASNGANSNYTLVNQTFTVR